jgi:hypothetical protein
MEWISNTLVPWLQDNWFAAAMAILNLGLFAKVVVLKAAVKEFFVFVKEVVEAKKNGVVSDEECIPIGRAAIKFSETLWSLAKGLFPNRSKV